MAKYEDLVKEAEELRGRIVELGELEEASDEQRAEFDAKTERFDQVEKEIKAEEARQAKVEEVRKFAANPRNVVTGEDKGPEVIIRSDKNIFDLSEVRYGNPEARASELRARALDAIEQAPSHVGDAARENATKLVERSDADGKIAEHILTTSSPEYQSAFLRYMRRPQDMEARAALSTTDANGGFLIPALLDPTIILTNNGATNPIRGIATVVTGTSNIWEGVSSAGVTAEWLGEGTEAADASPTFSGPTITAHKAAAYVEASYEILADSNVAAQIPGLIADAKDRLEATAFVTGSGTSQPFGVVTDVSAITASRVAATTNNSYGAVDVYAVASALPPRYRANSSWIAEQTIINLTRQFDTSGGSSFWANLGMGDPEQLLGRPIYEASAMDGSIVSGSNDDVLLLGDFRAGYYIYDRVGVSIKYEDIVKGSSQRPNGKAGWIAFWRVGAKTVDTNAFRLLRV